MKAYKVSCRDDDHGAVIRFAERAKDVSRDANSERCDCDFIDKTVHRAPKFDDLANIDRPLTPKDHVDRGWYWCCQGCHNEQLMQEDNPLYVGGDVYCNVDCVEDVFRRYSDLVAGGNAHESIVELWTEARDYLAALGVV